MTSSDGVVFAVPFLRSSRMPMNIRRLILILYFDFDLFGSSLSQSTLSIAVATCWKMIVSVDNPCHRIIHNRCMSQRQETRRKYIKQSLQTGLNWLERSQELRNTCRPQYVSCFDSIFGMLGLFAVVQMVGKHGTSSLEQMTSLTS